MSLGPTLLPSKKPCNLQNCKQQAYAYKPLNAAPDFRLLELEPGEWDDDIICQLEHSSLDEDPKYEALSYLWGNPAETRPIILGGSRHQVTINLESALRHLRHGSEPRTLWIDALCINQADLAERAEQVQKMYAIYSQAGHVVAWTGVASHDSDEGMELLRAFGKFCDTALSSDGLLDGQDTISSKFTSLGFPMETQNWTSVFNFFDRPYWSRMWVIQELATRGHIGPVKPCTIICGRAKIDIQDYHNACAGIHVIVSSPNTTNPDTNDWDGPNRFLIRGNHTYPPQGLVMLQAITACEGKTPLGPPTMKLLRNATRAFEATDDRDRIYALLGLAVKEERFVLPDYKKPIKTLLMEYTKFFVDRDQSLNVIFSNRTEACSTAPSWAPEVHGGHQAHDLWGTRQLDTYFRASGESKAQVEFDEKDGLMRSRGLLIGELTRVIGPFRDSLKLAGPATSAGDLSAKLGHDGVMEELRSYSRTLSEAGYEAFWRTFILDRDEDYPLGPWTSPASLEKRRPSRVFFKHEPVPPEFMPEATASARYIQYVAPYFSPIVYAYSNHTFFSTASGLMGLGPYCAQPRDVVAVLYGCDRCTILRPKSGGYTIVGDAYVHGAMRGELLKTKWNGIEERVFDIF